MKGSVQGLLCGLITVPILASRPLDLFRKFAVALMLYLRWWTRTEDSGFLLSVISLGILFIIIII